MEDREFLSWLHVRLVEVHGEHPHTEHMHKLRAIIKATVKGVTTPNCGTGNCLRDVLND